MADPGFPQRVMRQPIILAILTQKLNEIEKKLVRKGVANLPHLEVEFLG